MTTRIADLASSNTVIARILETQKHLHDLETQVATEKKSQTYQGIAQQSQRLVNYENARDQLETFIANNETMEMRLDTTSSVLDGIKKTITDFREALFDYEAGTLTDEQRVKDVQDAAFRALTDLSVHLNSDVDGRFIFAGSRVTDQPVNMGLTNLTDFQTLYDGNSVVYPPTRESNVETELSLSAADLGGLTMSGTDTITSTNATALAGLTVGSTITIANSAGGNDGTYTVVSTNGSNQITISGAMSVGASTINIANTVNNGADATATIAVSSYYEGDTATQQHRVSENRDFDIDLNAIDPAFEKAIRAMGLIAQGAFGTAGGLDQNTGRLDQAIYLTTSALELNAVGTAPFGTESTGNLRQVQQDLGYQQVLVSQTNEQHENLIAFFDQRVVDTENIDSLEVISRLLDESNALEAAYQAISRLQQLSLTNYL